MQNACLARVISNVHLQSTLCHYQLERSKGEGDSKVRAANEYYDRKIKIVTIIALPCMVYSNLRDPMREAIVLTEHFCLLGRILLDYSILYP